jgi:M6 family metalloprotease-like protein
MKKLSFLLVCCAVAQLSRATEPPLGGGAMPRAFRERLRQDPSAFNTKRGLMAMTSRAMASQGKPAATLSAMGLPPVSSSQPLGPAKIAGSRSIPVLLASFSDTAANPIEPARLQQQLFGSWPTGTMTDFYKEISYGAFTVTGSVQPWRQLSKAGAYYQGADFGPADAKEPCFGLCPNAKLGDYLRESIEAAGASFDWAQYDNDGPDGKPNSGDDDGFVDFVAFVHPGTGGECGSVPPAVNKNIWSHRSSYSGWTGSSYTTKSPRTGGGFIEIDDYVIMPSLACDGATMIQIGVFAHEFGHAFGLPDLYDTDRDNGASSGLGNWCLMAGGSWGGDGRSPERPVHMNPWAKAYLGWANIKPVPVGPGALTLTLPPFEDAADAYELRVSASQYYYITNVGRKKFDGRFPVAGLAIWQMNQPKIDSGLRNNRVNADPSKGVALVEASGLKRLDDASYRGGDGDLFPGTTGRTRFDNSGPPKSLAGRAMCGIRASGENIVFDLQPGNRCPGGPGTTPTAPSAAAASGPAMPRTLASEGIAGADAAAAGKDVHVQGVLTNVGENYQNSRTRRIVLRDAAGQTIDVRQPFSLETAGGGSGPKSLAAYLDKPMEVTGVVTTAPDGKPVLEIKSAKPIQ